MEPVDDAAEVRAEERAANTVEPPPAEGKAEAAAALKEEELCSGSPCGVADADAVAEAEALTGGESLGLGECATRGCGTVSGEAAGIGVSSLSTTGEPEDTSPRPSPVRHSLCTRRSPPAAAFAAAASGVGSEHEATAPNRGASVSVTADAAPAICAVRMGDGRLRFAAPPFPSFSGVGSGALSECVTLMVLAE